MARVYSLFLGLRVACIDRCATGELHLVVSLATLMDLLGIHSYRRATQYH
jgi:hypothetical protein